MLKLWINFPKIQGSHWHLVTGIKVFSRIFKVNNNIFQGYISSNSLIYVPLKKNGPLTKLWKSHVKFQNSWLHITFKDFSRTLFNFDQIQGLSRPWKWTNFFKDFQGLSRMWEPWDSDHKLISKFRFDAESRRKIYSDRKMNKWTMNK